MRHSTHRHGIATLFVTRCECDLQFARTGESVVKKQFVEIAETKKQQCPGMLLLQFLVLTQHRRLIGLGHIVSNGAA